MIHKIKGQALIDKNSKLEMAHHQEVIRKLKEEKEEEVLNKNGRNNN